MSSVDDTFTLKISYIGCFLEAGAGTGWRDLARNSLAQGYRFERAR